MKKVILVLVAFVFVMTGCGTTGSTNGGADTSEVSAIINEHLGISPYIPETDYKLGAVVLEHDLVNLEPHYATINYYDSSGDLTEPDEETMASFEERFPERKVVYGTLYIESSVISIEVYPVDGLGGGMHDEDAEIIDISGHDVKYVYYKKGDGRDLDFVVMAINFDDVGYRILYNVQSDNIEEEAKKLAEEIIKNNS